MPRFFFDTHSGERLVKDDLGLELPDRETARRQALAALPGMARDELPAGVFTALYVNVRDESRRAIYTACMTLVGRWLD